MEHKIYNYIRHHAVKFKTNFILRPLNEYCVEQDALMSPNMCRKLENLVAGCVCCLVDFNLLIHSLK